MDKKALKEAYMAINANNQRRLLFHLTQRGFGSEVNNMLLAILYCLENKMEFCLYSKSWNAAYKFGWRDYFKEFCPEYKSLFLYRQSVLKRKGYQKVRYFYEYFFHPLQKLFFPRFQYTIDIWSEMCSDHFTARKFKIDELGIDGDIFHAKQVILDMIFDLNSETYKQIEKGISQIEVFRPYVSVHMRRGDKEPETPAVDVDKYVEIICRERPDIKNIFVATDDFRVIEEFIEICPDFWNVRSFCSETELGFDQRVFNMRAAEKRRKDTYRLLIDLFYLSRGEIFVGTFSSNIARFVVLRRGGVGCYSLDIDWHGV